MGCAYPLPRGRFRLSAGSAWSVNSAFENKASALGERTKVCISSAKREYRACETGMTCLIDESCKWTLNDISKQQS